MIKKINFKWISWFNYSTKEENDYVEVKSRKDKAQKHKHMKLVIIVLSLDLRISNFRNSCKKAIIKMFK